jgi:hypothetical protein
MKKIYILAVLVTFVSFGFAQKHVGKPISTKSISINSESRSTTDTLYAVPWQTVNACDSFFIYGVSGGGYVTGTNNYGDLEKAQKFSLTGLTNPIQVTNILAPFWTNTPTSTANIVMKIYSVNTTTKGPQTLLGTSNAVTISQIVTGGMTNFTFTTPVTVTTSFFASFVVPSADTAVVYESKQGCWSNDSLAFELWSPAPGTWHSMYASWGTTGFQMDLAIFPVITTGSGVQDYFIDGIKLGQNQPNPATSTTMIQYEVQNSSKVSLDIYDITGRLVLTMDEGNQMAGKHSIVIDANKLQAGSYFYSLKAGDKRLTKQMVIE